MNRPRRIFGMTEREWYAQGNPPGSFDDIFEMARQNSEHIRRHALRPHPWDEWQVPAPEADPEAGGES